MIDKKSKPPVKKMTKKSVVSVSAVKIKTARKAPNSDTKSTTTQNLSAPIFDIDGKNTGDFSLPAELFSVDSNPSLLALAVRVYLANQRQGTVDTQTRSEVAYSTRKIYRQKGTGRARHGSRRAPIFVGGGVTFGPKPADKGLKINKKQARLALLMSLSNKVRDGKIVVVDIDPTRALKTNNFASLLSKIILNGKRKSILATKSENDRSLNLACANIDFVKTFEASNLNPYLVISAENLVFSRNGLESFINSKNSN